MYFSGMILMIVDKFHIDMIYPHSCCSEPIAVHSFICLTQNEMLSRMLELLFPINHVLTDFQDLGHYVHTDAHPFCVEQDN